MQLLGYFFQGSATSATENVEEQFKFLLANYRDLVPQKPALPPSAKTIDELFHQYCDFSSDEIVFKLFCNIHSDEDLECSIGLLQLDSDTLDDKARATVQHCYRHWLLFQSYFFDADAQLARLAEFSRDARLGLVNSKKFYQGYHIQKARNYAKRKHLKTALEHLVEVNTLVNWTSFRELEFELKEDWVCKKNSEKVALLTGVYEEVKGALGKVESKRWDASMKKRVRARLYSVLSGIEAKVLKLLLICLKKRTFDFLHESGLVAALDRWKERHSYHTPELHNYDFKALMNSALEQLVSTLTDFGQRKAEGETPAELTDLTPAVEESLDEFSNLITAYQTSVFGATVKLDFGAAFRKLLDALSNLSSKGLLSLSIVSSIHRVMAHFQNDTHTKEAFDRLVQHMWEKSVIQRLYAIVLNFDRTNMLEMNFKRGYLSAHESLKNDSEFQAYLQKTCEQPKQNGQSSRSLLPQKDHFVYNSLTLACMDAFINCLQDFRQLHALLPDLRRIPKVEDFTSVILTFFDTQKLENDISVKNSILSDRTYFNHKISVLSTLKFSFYSDYLVRKEKIRRSSNTHFESGVHLVEFDGLKRELKHIKSKLNDKLREATVEQKNFFLSLQARLTVAYVFRSFANMQNIVAGFFRPKLPDFEFEIDKELASEFTALCLESLFSDNKYEDFVDSLTSNLNVKSDNEQFYGLLFGRVLTEINSTLEFMNFALKGLFEDDFWKETEIAFERLFMADLVTVVFNTPHQFTEEQVADSVAKFKREAPSKLTLFAAEIRQEIDEFLGHLEQYLRQPDAEVDAKIRHLTSLKRWVNVTKAVAALTKNQASDARAAHWEALVKSLADSKILKI